MLIRKKNNIVDFLLTLLIYDFINLINLINVIYSWRKEKKGIGKIKRELIENNFYKINSAEQTYFSLNLFHLKFYKWRIIAAHVYFRSFY